MNLTAEIYRAQLNQPLHWSWMLRGRFKIEQIFLMHILSLWKAAYDAWEWFRDYPRLQFHEVKLHIAHSRYSRKKRRKTDTLHGTVSFLGFSAHAPDKHCPYHGNYLETREIACCPNDHNKVGLPMFHFFFNCRFTEFGTIYASGLAGAVRRVPFSNSTLFSVPMGRQVVKTVGFWCQIGLVLDPCFSTDCEFLSKLLKLAELRISQLLKGVDGTYLIW